MILAGPRAPQLAQRRPRIRSVAVVEPRAMQAAPGDPRSEVLGFASMGGDPRQDGRGVGALREDCGTLDDLAAGGVRSRQARDQGADRVVVHGSEASRPARESTRLPSRRRATGLPGRTEPLVEPVSAVQALNHKSRPWWTTRLVVIGRTVLGLEPFQRVGAYALCRTRPHPGDENLHGRSRSSRASALSAMSRASASDEVAAGEGALRTCSARSVSETTKSSISAPSRPSA